MFFKMALNDKIFCKEKTKACLALLNKKIDNDNDR